MSDSEIAKDVRASMDDLEDLNDKGSSFGCKMVIWASKRKENYPAAVANGKKGGRPKKNTSPSDSGKSAATLVSNDSSGGSEHQKALTVVGSAQGSRNGEPLTAHGPNRNVFLTEGEIQKYEARFGSSDYMIDRLSTYMANTGKSYPNHFSKIWEWAMADVANDTNPATGKRLDQLMRIKLAAKADGVDLDHLPPPPKKPEPKPRPYEGPIGFEQFG